MPQINSILIANRGEIASRIIRTCKKMGIRSIAVFSEADRDMPFVKEANVAVLIGESSPSASYLNQEKLIETAKKVQADAIHPGYGFLAENADFAQKCVAQDLIFIGPNPKAIAAMGSKSQAKKLMQTHAIPVVPGYQGSDQEIHTLRKAAIDIGFPVLLKATAGGGGKGMRIVQQEGEIEEAIHAAKREALSAFGNDELIIEKYIASGRHIEFQIFGDQHGNAIHILERECTIQRRYQKVIEESPSPIMTEELRNKMGTAAVQAATALQYDNAGTVEFIYDEKSGEFYFLEVNTRLQVEHPVTEEITGLDLVQMQIEVAQGISLSISQDEIQGKGYAIECRLYAEDPQNNFLPSTGKVHVFQTPQVEGLRVESAIQSGSEISIFYDPMIAKLIVWDTSRQSAHRKMKYVLSNMVCLGLKSNQGFLLKILEHQAFTAGQYDTHFIADNSKLYTEEPNSKDNLGYSFIAATLYAWEKRESKRLLLKSIPSGWRNNFYEYQHICYLYDGKEILVKYRYLDSNFHFLIEDKAYFVSLIECEKQYLRIEIDGMDINFQVINLDSSYYLHNEQTGNIYLEEKKRFPPKSAKKSTGGYEAPMPSQVVKVLVSQGQQIAKDDGLIVLSSMKMENTVYASAAGKVEEIYAKEGENIPAGFLLLKIASNNE